jgi:hypothetical protein
MQYAIHGINPHGFKPDADFRGQPQTFQLILLKLDRLEMFGLN